MTEHRSERAQVLLTIDCGNSTFDLRLCDVDGVPIRRERQVDLDLAKFVGDRTPFVVASSVRSDRWAIVERELEGKRWPVRIAGVDFACPLQLAYPNPKELGADRWIGALAAVRRHGDAVVIDCGTAVTWNVVRRDGMFLGGAIGLGLRSQIRSMRERAPELPDIEDAVLEAAELPRLPAVTTLDSLVLGIHRAFVHSLVGLRAELQVKAGLAAVTTVVTGGDAWLVLGGGGADLLGPRVVVESELIHDGLADLGRRSLGRIKFGRNGVHPE